MVAVLFAAGKYRCELLRVEIHLDTSPLGQEYQVFIFPYLHLVDTVACHYCIRRSFKIRVSESSAGNIENGQSAGVRTDIQLVAFGAVGYIFQVVVCDGVLVRVGHEIGECLLFPVEEVQSAAFGADPDILVFIFHHMSDKGETDTVVSGLIRRIKGKQIHFGIEIMDTSVISPQPDTSLLVFENRKDGRVGEAARKIVAGIDLEMTVMRIVFVQSRESAYPEISEVIFHNPSDLVAGDIVCFRRVIAETFEVTGRFPFIKSVHSCRDPQVGMRIFEQGIDIFARNDTVQRFILFFHV